jgi:hypothetical protein
VEASDFEDMYIYYSRWVWWWYVVEWQWRGQT